LAIVLDGRIVADPLCGLGAGPEAAKSGCELKRGNEVGMPSAGDYNEERVDSEYYSMTLSARMIA